ncbi:TonB-dependent receptor [Massilia sp. S19_KUP03_FR1]|uniref:TonB-dependent receptor n=1 Tax=Massilia sp. S19_KUP03_FR1 TaxID=3025503 RepID=UPI002FCD7047
MKIFASKRVASASNSIAFRLHPVAAGAAILAAFASSAYAETEVAAPAAPTEQTAVQNPGLNQADTTSQANAATEPAIQTVKVTGIRRGIEAAISVKKNNDSIVEAISAEDIGKLPDSSIAESIARLPGVTAQRTAGRASAISIRGMSPDFSTALLNGREQVSTGDSRGVEFDQYPSELLSSVVIYKTPDGALVGQGLSGTVDMQTVRPLDFSKRTIAVNARKEKNSLGLTQNGDGKRYSLSYIDQFADRTIGVALGFARLDSKSGERTRFESWGNGTVKSVNGVSLGQTNGVDNTVQVPYNGFNAFTDVESQKRDGAMAVLQFRPNKNFSSTLDLFYSKFDNDKATHGIQVPLNDTTNNAFDKPGELINATVVNGVATSGSFNNVRAVVRNEATSFSDTSKSVGWNNKLKLNDDWTASVDLSYNTAVRNGANAEAYAGTTGALDTVSFTGGSEIFKTGLNYADPNIVKLTDVQGWGGADIQAGYTKIPHVADKIRAARFDLARDLPDGWWFSKLMVGANYTTRSKQRDYTEALLSIKGNSSPFASAAVPNATAAVAGTTGIPVLAFDPVANAAVYNANRKNHPDIYNKDWVVNERVSTGFAKLNIDSQVSSIPLRGALALQFVHTVQDSTAFSVDSATPGSTETSRPTTPYTNGTSYSDVLPSLNLIGDLGNQQSLRFSVSKIMARPTMNDMRASSSFGLDATKTPREFSGSGGTPTLKPFRAKGIDLSYEKYWDTKAYVSLATFYKKLDTYIVNTSESVDFTPYVLPTTIQLPSNIGSFTHPVNGSGGKIKGVEFAVSVPLNLATRYLDGFGVVFNASQTSSDVNVPDTTDGAVAGAKIDLPGLSKRVASLTVYYEKAGFSARVAERYRSDFIGEVNRVEGDRQLTYVQAEKQIDLQLGYEFENGPMKGLSIMAQMTNLGNEPFRRYRRTRDNNIENTTYGRTVLFGLNYKM